ncbi:7355_t:CDS:1, partial [Dentiscutata erythropus]
AKTTNGEENLGDNYASNTRVEESMSSRLHSKGSSLSVHNESVHARDHFSWFS